MNSTEQVKARALSYLQTMRQMFRDITEGKEISAKTHQKYLDDNAYFQDFRAKEGKNYEVVAEYLKTQLQNLKDTDKSLDDKAESLIKILGSGSALVSFGTLLSLKLDNPNALVVALSLIISLLPLLIFSGISLYYAVRTRKPREASSYPDVKFAVDCVNEYEADEASICIWLIQFPMCTQYAFRNQHKSNDLEKAYWHYKYAIYCLGLPFMATIITLAVLISNPIVAK